MNILDAIAGGPGTVMQGVANWISGLFSDNPSPSEPENPSTPTGGGISPMVGVVAVVVVVGLVWYLSRKT